MSESKAAESYQAFESLINRFGGTTRTPERDSHAHQWREKPKRNVFASAAPPLVPLMEESDQLQEELFSRRINPNQPSTSPVKGKWKHSTVKSNHLNAPDCDALETESVASCSDSAYSSKSESLSPITGSFSELSDRVSPDPRPQNHVKNSDASTVYIKQTGRLETLKATFEAGGGGHSIPSMHDPAHDSDADSVSSEAVPLRTKAWNKAIGEWVFEGIKALDVPSPKGSPRVRRPSNEVRLPTPLSTPLYGSMENLLLDSGSHTSLLSSSGVWEDGEDNASWNQDTKYPLGKFVPPGARRSSIAAISLKKTDSPPLNMKGHTPPAAKANGSIESRPLHSQSTAWIEAKKKHDMLRMKTERRQSAKEEPEWERKPSAGTIEQRAKLFGETRPRRGLRRTQSLLVHSQSSPRTARGTSARDMSKSFV